MHDLTEYFQYYLISASVQLAIEKGNGPGNPNPGYCTGFKSTKYSTGQLPIDTYKKEVDSLVPPQYKLDWNKLRDAVVKFGMRHSTLTAQMPSESSSVVCNATNGIEPPRDFLSVKKSKKGTLKQIVPGYPHLKNNYTLLWNMKSMEGYLNIMAVMQKFFDQAISTNTSYNPQHFDGGEVPASTLIGDLLKSYQLGIKTLYYQNTYDGKGDEELEERIELTAEDLLAGDDTCDTCSI